MGDESTLDFLESISMAAFRTGSRVICSPPVLDTDDDYVVYRDAKTEEQLLGAGFVKTSPESYGERPNFIMFRKGDVNVITTADGDSYNKWLFATRIAKALKLNRKEDRIVLFQAIVDGNYPED